MTNLEEEQIYFVGKDSFKENENPTDKKFLIKLINKIKIILNNKTNKMKNLSPKLKIDLKINIEDPNLRFNLTYPDYDLYPDQSIKEFGLEIQEKISELLENSFNKYPNFFYDFSPGWDRGSYLSISLFVRPFRGNFTCPVCKREVEDSDENYICDNFPKENIAVCLNTGHETFFVEKFINTIFETEKPFEIDKNLKIHIINPNDRIHRLLAFQLKVIAKNEEISFLTPDIEYGNSKMYILTKEGIPVGYAFWNDFNSNKRCFRQIFVRKRCRRKGYATILTEKTVEIECGRNKNFVVETPNEKTEGILLKLGYVKKANNHLLGIRCSFTQGF